jgi:uncharacterized protein YkwD
VRNWRTSIRSPYAIALAVMAFATWLALRQFPNDNPMAPLTAAIIGANTQTRPDPQRAATVIVTKTNQFREEQGLNRVEVDARLAGAARDFADYMAATDKYSHTADGKTPSERATEHGYDYCLVSENIAYLYSSSGFGPEQLADKMFEGWKESPEHRKNMLHTAVTQTGVAVAHSAKSGNFYGVQMFGRPKSLSISFSIENHSEVPIEYTTGERTYELPPHNRYTHEECLPVDLKFQLPGESNRQQNTFRPRDDDQFIISGPADRLKVERK